jgi:delta-aminolevulinic acid dehydratase/porphobilinogen synthase
MTNWDGNERRSTMNGFDPSKCMLGMQHQEQIQALNKALDEMKRDIKEIKDKLILRPTWSVMIIISVLSAISVASMTFAFAVIQYGKGVIK